MDFITKEEFKRNKLSIDDCRSSMIRLLYEEAAESRVFAEMECLIGIGAFQECFPTMEEGLVHYREFVDDFYLATGKRFLGGSHGEPPATAEDYAPDPNLSKEEYDQALADCFFDAQSGALEADEWELYGTDRDYEKRLKYGEFLGMQAGMNAWHDWLDELIDLGSEGTCEAFMEEADKHFFDRFFELIDDMRKMKAENVE